MLVVVVVAALYSVCDAIQFEFCLSTISLSAAVAVALALLPDRYYVDTHYYTTTTTADVCVFFYSIIHSFYV